MTTVQELKREARMTLFRRFREDGKASYVVRGPARQEKVFADQYDAESYFRYYVTRCRREEPAAPVD